MMISFETGANKFQYRAACIVIHNKQILLQRAIDSQLWFIPGGRVEFGETAAETVDREMIEEFGVEIIKKKLVWMVENFIHFPDKQVHEIGTFFYVDLTVDHTIFLHENEFIGAEEGFVNRWIPLESLDDFKIIPEFVVAELRVLDLDIGIKHIINKSVR